MGALFLCVFAARGQDEQEDLYDMSLEDLMNLEIVSASKKAESLFDAPLSSYTITKEDMLRAGSTAIPDALKLCPGLIVREYTNGAYDVHIRGFDNITRWDGSGEHVNKISLVMVDDRPIFNHVNGITIWEAIPVGINDVERIEIVYGPSSALFGPNAVSGVINIITTNPDKDGVGVFGNVQYGSFNSLMGGANVTFKKNRLDVMVSGNVDMRNRYESRYYEFARDIFVDDPADLRDGFNRPIENVEDVYDDPDMSVNKYGFNAFVNYQFNEEASIGVDAGYQDTRLQTYFYANGYTPFTISSYESKYVNVIGNFKGLKARYSHTAGHDRFSQYDEGGTSAQYDYTLNEVFVDYNWQLTDNLSLQPGFNFLNANYGAYEPINTIAGALRLDYFPVDQLRLIASARLDHFNKLPDNYWSYQFAATYKVNDKNLIRGVASKSTSGAFIGPVLLDIFVEIDVGLGVPMLINYQGNQDLSLFSLKLYELGYRTRLLNNLELDVAFFQQTGNSFYAKINKRIPMGYLPFGSQNVEYQNLPVKATQNGMTLSLNWVPGSKWQVKPFLTYQKTTSVDMPTGLNEPDLDDTENVEITFDDEHESTPTFYGGMYLNYSPIKRLNINFNPYYMSGYKIYHYNEVNNATMGEIDNRILLNARVAYEVIDGLDLFVNMRNMSFGESREYYGTDIVKTMYLGGVNFNF
jgi:iron complex outermembrane receptor protein